MNTLIAFNHTFNNGFVILKNHDVITIDKEQQLRIHKFHDKIMTIDRLLPEHTIVDLVAYNDGRVVPLKQGKTKYVVQKALFMFSFNNTILL
jgi:hypothetical protein